MPDLGAATRRLALRGVRTSPQCACARGRPDATKTARSQPPGRCCSADIEAFEWTKIPRGGALSVKKNGSPTSVFVGFRDQVRDPPPGFRAALLPCVLGPMPGCCVACRTADVSGACTVGLHPALLAAAPHTGAGCRQGGLVERGRRTWIPSRSWCPRTSGMSSRCVHTLAVSTATQGIAGIGKANFAQSCSGTHFAAQK